MPGTDDTAPSRKLSALLRRLSAKDGRPHKDLAKAVGLSEPWVSTAINGKAVAAASLRSLLKELNASDEELELAVDLLVQIKEGASTDAPTNVQDDHLVKLRVTQLLEVALKVLHSRRPKRHIYYRALVTAREDNSPVRRTFSYVSELDPPESAFDVVWDFGVAGNAYKHGVFSYKEFSPGEAHLDSNGMPVPGISEDLRCVLAWPLRVGDSRVFGTLNLDSNAPMSTACLEVREVQAAFQHVGNLCAQEMFQLPWLSTGAPARPTS